MVIGIYKSWEGSFLRSDFFFFFFFLIMSHPPFPFCFLSTCGVYLLPLRLIPHQWYLWPSVLSSTPASTEDFIWNISLLLHLVSHLPTVAVLLVFFYHVCTTQAQALDNQQQQQQAVTGAFAVHLEYTVRVAYCYRKLLWYNISIPTWYLVVFFFFFFFFLTSIQETAGYSQSQDRATHIILSCTLAHMHSHTHACTHPCMHTPMHACMCACTHTHTHTRTHRCMHAPMRVHQKSDFTFLFLTSSVTPSWLLHFAQNSLFVAFCNFPCCFTEKNECASML